MRVTVRFFGVLKDLTGCSEESLEIAPGTTINGVFRHYAERCETLQTRRPSILFARNHEFVKADEPLAENDELAFLPPVSGGSDQDDKKMSGDTLRIDDAAGHRFGLTRQVLDAQALSRSLQRPEDGAAVVFEGIVRNHSRGRTTQFLEYECYESMALQQMARIGREIAEQFSVGRIGVLHRLGRLAVGETSVVVAATAAHRRPAFDAALEAINRIKKEVPIWKKEFFADGAVWVDGEWDEELLRKARNSTVPGSHEGC